MKNKEIVVVLDTRGNPVVVINNIIFCGKKSLPWNEVEQYLRKYIGDVIKVSETGELINIGKDFPDEFKGSDYTNKMKGGNAKAKANVIQAIHEIIEIAKKVKEMINKKDKNKKKAQYGWYRYITRFAFPMMEDGVNVSHYNIYKATIIVRKNRNKKLYLYDVINIKKEASAPLELNNLR